MGYTPKKNGFTLIELLVVIAIIGILASVVLASINSARNKARTTTVRAQLKSIATAIGMLVDDSAEWPGHQPVEVVQNGASGNEIEDLSVASAGIMATDGAYSRWQGPYLPKMPKDPWGNDYFFDTDYDIDPSAGQKWAAVLGSYGPNGGTLNAYDADDIIYILSSE